MSTFPISLYPPTMPASCDGKYEAQDALWEHEAIAEEFIGNELQVAIDPTQSDPSRLQAWHNAEWARGFIEYKQAEFTEKYGHCGYY